MEFEKIKKVIESCHLNFLIGSGASRPFLGTLGSIEKLLTDLMNNEDYSDEKRKVIEVSIKKHYFDVAIKGNLKFKKPNKSLNETKAAYKTFVQSINKILVKRKTNLISKQANIFTTNMDLFLELTLEENHLIFNDGFSGRLNPIFGTENFHNIIRKTSTHFEYQSDVPLFNLFKLHGSLNWKQNGEEIVYDHDLEILKSIAEIEIAEKDLLTIERKIKGKLKSYSLAHFETVYDRKPIKLNAEHEMFLEAFNKLVMINPTKDKFETTTRNLTFYELLRMYSNNLEKENSVLFVFGFSFADEHIKEITKRVSIANPTLLIVIFAYNENAKTEIENHLPSNNNIIILSSETIDCSLDIINTNYFERLSEDLDGIKTNNSNG